MIILDTCVISETLKPEPDTRVLAWLDTLDEVDVFLPALVLGELRRGVDLLPSLNRRAALSLWLVELEDRFAGRILAFDGDVAARWGALMTRLRRAGTPMPALDAQLAAHALAPGAVLATRNISDFEVSGCALLNPWKAT